MSFSLTANAVNFELPRHLSTPNHWVKSWMKKTGKNDGRVSWTTGTKKPMDTGCLRNKPCRMTVLHLFGESFGSLRISDFFVAWKTSGQSVRMFHYCIIIENSWKFRFARTNIFDIFDSCDWQAFKITQQVSLSGQNIKNFYHEPWPWAKTPEDLFMSPMKK